MPNVPRKQNVSNSNKPKFEDFKFVPLLLGSKDKDHFKTWWEESAADTFTFLDTLVNDGYKVTINWDERNGCYICSFTCLNSKLANYCLVLTSRSDTVFEAIGINLYKHLYMTANHEWPTARDDNWG